MKMREYTEREHKVKQHPLESPGHQKVKPGLCLSLSLSLSVSVSVSVSVSLTPTQGGRADKRMMEVI